MTPAHQHYLDTLKRAVDELGGQTAAAAKLGTKQSTISRWFSRNTSKLPVDLPQRVEQATSGRIKAEEFFA